MTRDIHEYPTDDVKVSRLLWYGGNPYDPAGMYANITYDNKSYQVFLAHKDQPPSGGKVIYKKK